MKARHVGVVLVLGAILLSSSLRAQNGAPPPPSPAFGGHYPAGVEGIKGGSLPPPGLYMRFYNLFYYAEQLRAENAPTLDKVFAYAAAPRVVWISDFKVLGGYYGADILVPIGYVDWEFSGPPPGVLTANDSFFGLGDIFVEPITLSWHPAQFDFGIGYGFWAPTGETIEEATFPPWQTRPSLLWKGFWSHMFTLGGTSYPDKEKTWALSLLNRYEIHMEHENFNITPGHTLTMEWGISKTFKKTIDVGAVGYYQQQTTADSGSGPGPFQASDYKDRVLSAGPEISVVWPKFTLITSLRYLREFGAKDRPEGNLWTLTLTKRF